jgi:hypothetical protein
MSFFTGLFWDLEIRSERRHGFPSWCWTGWYGSVKWEGPHCQTVAIIKVDSGVELNVKLIDERVLKLVAFQVLLSDSNLYTQLSNIIHITAWIREAKIRGFKRGTKKDRYRARLKLEDGGYLDWTFKSDSRIRF